MYTEKDALKADKCGERVFLKIFGAKDIQKSEIRLKTLWLQITRV